MTCKIERLAGIDNTVVLRICGRVELEHVDTLKDMIGRESGRIVLDLKEVTLVARDAVYVLATCELSGIELEDCPAFLREWITREQSHLAAERP
jgi:hypothetical protein